MGLGSYPPFGGKRGAAVKMPCFDHKSARAAVWLTILFGVWSASAGPKKKSPPPGSSPAVVATGAETTVTLPAPPPAPPSPDDEQTKAQSIKAGAASEREEPAPPRLQSRGERSRVIYPDQTIPLRFSHKNHLAKDIACDSCTKPRSRR